MTTEFTPGNRSEKTDSQSYDSGPGRIDAHEPTFYDKSDALSFADAFSAMEDP